MKMTAAESAAEWIYSQYDGDPDLGDLVALFVAEIPGRIAAMEQAWADRDRESLQRSAHQLRGSAGSYGLGALTPAAAALEKSLRDSAPDPQIMQLLAQLRDLCCRVRSRIPLDGC